MPVGRISSTDLYRKGLRSIYVIARGCLPCDKRRQVACRGGGKARQTRLASWCHLGGRCNECRTLSAMVGRHRSALPTIAVLATVGIPPWMATAPPLTRMVPAALRLTSMVLLAAAPMIISVCAAGIKDAVTASISRGSMGSKPETNRAVRLRRVTEQRADRFFRSLTNLDIVTSRVAREKRGDRLQCSHRCP